MPNSLPAFFSEITRATLWFASCWLLALAVIVWQVYSSDDSGTVSFNASSLPGWALIAAFAATISFPFAFMGFFWLGLYRRSSR